MKPQQNLDILTPPDYCQYVAGACDQHFESVPRVDGVILYPSDPHMIASVIEGAVRELNANGQGHWKTWRDFRVAGRVIYCTICRQMRFSRVIVADVTTLNQNLMFEIGFALGLELPLLLVRDTSYLSDMRNFTELGLLDTIGYVDFQTSSGLAASISASLPSDAIPVPAVELNRTTPIYLIRDPIHHEGQVQILSILEKSPLSFRSYDPIEETHLSLYAARKQVHASFGVIGHLLASERRGAIVHNARTALIAGMAVSAGKNVVLLQEGTAQQPIDYRDIVSPYDSPEQIPDRLAGIIYQVTVNLQQTRSKPLRAPRRFLEQLDLGDFAAENEIRQLHDYFVPTAQFSRVKQGHSRLVVGRKGAGKTAIFYALRDSLPQTYSHLILDMKPEGHQFTRLREAILEQLSPGVQEHVLTAFWMYILLCELAIKVLRSDESWAKRDDRRNRRFQNLKQFCSRHLPDDSGDISQRLLKQVARIVRRFENRRDSADSGKFTRSLFSVDIPKLADGLTGYLVEKEAVWLLIDNLDKGWPTRHKPTLEILLIRALLDATRQLQRKLESSGVAFHVVVFLRNDVYELLVKDTPDRDKDTAIRLEWDDPSFFRKITHRRIDATGHSTESFKHAWEMISTPIMGSQDSFGYILERTLMRPRDLLKFLHCAVDIAVNRGGDKVSQQDLEHAESAYSEDMLKSISFELSDVNPDMANAAYCFIDCPVAMSVDDARERMFVEGIDETLLDEAVRMLLWFGFFGVLKKPVGNPQYSHHIQYNIDKLLVMLGDRNGRVVIHPAFRTALGCHEP